MSATRDRSRPSSTTLVTGPVRSGKSRHAEHLLGDEPSVTYVATGRRADPADAEWSRRVEGHRARRPASWRTVETTDVAGVIASARGAVLVDCLGTWLTALVDEAGWHDLDAAAAHVAAARRADSSRRSAPRTSPVVIVTNEVGWSLVADDGVRPLLPGRARPAQRRSSPPPPPACTSSSPDASSTSATPPSCPPTAAAGRARCVTPGASPSAPSRRCRRGLPAASTRRTMGGAMLLAPVTTAPAVVAWVALALLTTHGAAAVCRRRRPRARRRPRCCRGPCTSTASPTSRTGSPRVMTGSARSRSCAAATPARPAPRPWCSCWVSTQPASRRCSPTRAGRPWP